MTDHDDMVHFPIMFPRTWRIRLENFLKTEDRFFHGALTTELREIIREGIEAREKRARSRQGR
jgi:hypothetical protein